MVEIIINAGYNFSPMFCKMSKTGPNSFVKTNEELHILGQIYQKWQLIKFACISHDMNKFILAH